MIHKGLVRTIFILASHPGVLPGQHKDENSRSIRARARAEAVIVLVIEHWTIWIYDYEHDG